MMNSANAVTGCLLVGDYTDEAECPTNLVFQRGEAVRPLVVADYFDFWSRDEGLREFTVLLKDGRVVAVRGHGLKHEPRPLAGQDIFSVVVRSTTAEALVAVFTSAEVTAIFHGDLRTDRKIA